MSVITSDVQGSLKEALYETLTGILSPDREIRQAAEQRVQALEVTEEFGIHLTEFVVNSNGHLPIRQLASILLKQYVQTHWSSLAEKFRPPELKHNVKEKIKELLPIGLREPISKVRAAVAYAISGIAHWDWPENWPALFDILVNCLSGENDFAVHGAMRVLTEFCHDLTDTQLPNVGPIILQEMYRILQDQRYSNRIRGRAVEIFTTIISLVAATGIYQRKFAEQYLQPVIPLFCERFIECLKEPLGSVNDSEFKTEIIKAINCIVTRVPKYIVDFLPQILPPIWKTLTQSAETYQEKTVNGSDNFNEEVDSDGKVVDFNNLIIAIFEFLHTIVDTKKFTELLTNVLPEVIYYLVIFMQITDDQIEVWTNNPNQFIQEDDQCMFVYNVRISAQEVLTALINHYKLKGVHILYNVISRHIDAMNQLRLIGEARNENKTWWKLQESSILALQICKDIVSGGFTTQKLEFDLISFLDTIILAILNDSGSPPLLLGRCLYFSGRYVGIMPLQISSRFLEAIINGLQENQPFCIRICAVKAIYWFIEASTKTHNTALHDIMYSHIPTIFQQLFNLASHPSTDILIMIMETFQILILQHKEFTASVENKICPLTIAVFLKFYSDPVILDLCHDIFKALTQNPSCIGPLQTRIIPTLMYMMTTNSVDKSKDEGSWAIAMDVLQVLVQHSPKPVNTILIEVAFPAACHCIFNSEDPGTLQSGGELVRTYLAVAAQQIISYQDAEGQTGLHYVMRIVLQLLNPQSSEFTATFVGRLILTLIKNVGNTLGENLDLLLKGVLIKMQCVETLVVMQSLIMVYAHLVHTEFDAVLNFLSTVPGPMGQSALAFVLSEWLSRQHLFLGSYDRKVSTVALCKILEHGITQSDHRFDEITVKGEQIFPGNEHGVRTRSKTESQPYEWTTVPVLVKIFKVIICEYSNWIEALAASDPSDETDEDEENQETYIDPGYDNNILESEDDSTDDSEEDECVVYMPRETIRDLDLAGYLRDFLMNFSNHQCFSVYILQLNIPEQKTLNHLCVQRTFM